VNPTNLILIKLLLKQGKEVYKLNEKKETKDEDNNSNLFNKLIN